MPRRLQLNNTLIDEAARLIRIVRYVAPVAKAMGITRKTWYQWYNRGRAEKKRVDASRRRSVRQSEQIYVRFYEAIEQAQGQSEVDSVEVIKRHGERFWQSHAWYLERAFRERWTKEEIRQEVKSAISEVLEGAGKSLPQEALDAHYKEIQRELGIEPASNRITSSIPQNGNGKP